MPDHVIDDQAGLLRVSDIRKFGLQAFKSCFLAFRHMQHCDKYDHDLSPRELQAQFSDQLILQSEFLDLG